MQSIIRNSWKKRAVSVALVVLMSICLLVSGFAIGQTEPVYAADGGDVTVFVSLEGYNINVNNGWFIKPTMVTLPAGATEADATIAVLTQIGMIPEFWSGGNDYINRIKVGRVLAPDPPLYNSGLAYTPVPSGDWLGGSDYDAWSGWMNTLNHVIPSIGASDVVLHDGDVIRWQFSVNNAGEDLGLGLAGGYWAENTLYNHADKTQLIRNLFAAGNAQEKIDAALDVIINPLATAGEVSATNTDLGTYNPATDGGKNKYDKLFDTVKKTKLTEAPKYGNEFTVVLQAREGSITEVAKAGYLQDLADKIIPVLKENNGRVDRNKSTENSRIILALTALGVDATNFDGYDLTAALADLDWVKKQGVNGPTYALIALDSAKHDVPKLPTGSAATQTTRENLISTIVGAKIAGGGWALTGTTPDADITGMVLQALAPYYGKGNAALDSAVDEALQALKVLQHEENAGFGSPLAEGLAAYSADVSTMSTVSALATPTITAESTAQVLMAQDALGLSIYDALLVKNNSTTYDALHLFALRNAGGVITGFSHTTGAAFNTMATEMGMLALLSHSLALKGQRLFDFTGTSLLAYKALGAGSPQTSDEMPLQIYLAFAVVSLIIMSGAVLAIRRQRRLER